MIDTDKTVKHVETLIAKAAEAGDSHDAMRFSQAACNAANALSAVKSNERMEANALSAVKSNERMDSK